ncbi:hypothetical protein IMSHALPRED_003642 [Imshaugia aleurites]|uniref:F-box domain-containing protein n=1 Tax=Imshaugia aleurites TaxID=172621 RepID=A0A8H3J7W7_9LECA|nr:hypothetical protein IMSHALPRED_003642 [Imshaugia aleurites]
MAPSYRPEQRRAGCKSLQDLPTELILEVYKHFNHISQIVALNSTSRIFYQIWRLDPDRISTAVVPRSIPYHDATVEIQQAEERQQKLDPYRRPDPLKALKDLLEGCLATSPVSSDNAAYAAILERNRRLVRIANKNDTIYNACKASCVRYIGRDRITRAFCRIWLMTIRNSRKFAQFKADLQASNTLGDDRNEALRAMRAVARDDLARVVRFLLF